MDQTLSSIATQYRNLCQTMRDLSTQVNGQAAGLAYLEGLGYTNTANPLNPGGISDAQYALNVVNYLSTLAGVYYGTVQQGGTGGTGAIDFNFDNAFSPLWANQ